MPGLSKILLLLGLAYLGWQGWRLLQKLQREGKLFRGRNPSDPDGHPQAEVEDMTACRVCGTYIAANRAQSCGRNDCPY